MMSYFMTRVLNAYHNQILMLARLGKPSTYISTYKH